MTGVIAGSLVVGMAVSAGAQSRCGLSPVNRFLLQPKVVSQDPGKYEEFPATATIVLSKTVPPDWGHVCGATIISAGWVATAAHCVVGCAGENPPEISVRFGGDIYETGGSGTVLEKPVAIARIVRNDYRTIDPASFGLRGEPIPVNDIALIELAEPIPLAQIGAKSADLATVEETERLVRDRKPLLKLAGFGSISRYDRLPIKQLRMARFPLAGEAECNQMRYYNGAVDPDSMLCGGSEDKPDLACNGDSGSGLILDDEGKLKLVGLVSWSRACAAGFGIYTNVPRYRDWILETIRQSREAVFEGGERK